MNNWMNQVYEAQQFAPILDVPKEEPKAEVVVEKPKKKKTEVKKDEQVVTES